MDCDREWLAEHTPIQTPLHIDAPHPNHTMRARSNRTGALKTALYAQNGAARSLRRYAFKQCYTLKTALCVQMVMCAHYGAVRSNGAARSKRRCVLKTALRAQNGAARSNEVRQGVGRLVRKGRQGGRQGSAD